jgi:glutathione S-transferase
MIELHTMVPAWGLPTFTPFGLKLYAYMKLSAIPFRVVIEHDPRRGPKGKFPWIVDAGHAVADSGFVVEHLAQRFGDRLDGWLDARTRALGHAQRRMIEESLCFAMLYYRWSDDATYRQATEVALAGMPVVLRHVARPLIRRRILRDLWGQGVLRHTRAEVCQLGRADLDAMSHQLGDQAFFLGDRPSSLDATAVAFLSVLLRVPFDNELRAHAEALPNLVRYCARLGRMCFDSASA